MDNWLIFFLFCCGLVEYSLLESMCIGSVNQLFEKGGGQSQSKMLVSPSNNKQNIKIIPIMSQITKNKEVSNRSSFDTNIK